LIEDVWMVGGSQSCMCL